MSRAPIPQRVGEVRPSQVIHTFGVGSIVDLPNFSAIVMGLDQWETPTPQDVVVETSTRSSTVPSRTERRALRG